MKYSSMALHSAGQMGESLSPFLGAEFRTVRATGNAMELALFGLGRCGSRRCRVLLRILRGRRIADALDAFPEAPQTLAESLAQFW